MTISRRLFLTSMLGGGAIPILGIFARPSSRPAVATTATPFPAPDDRYCSWDLDAPDYTIVLEIPDEVYPDQHEQIEWIVDSRAKAAGVGACNIHRSERTIQIDAQGRISDDPEKLARLVELLSAPGWVSFINPTGNDLEVGDRVEVNQFVVGTQGTPDPGIVYEPIVTNLDIVSVKETRSQVSGDLVLSITLNEAGATALSSYSASHQGESLPVVIDGVVVVVPVIQGQTGAEIEIPGVRAVVHKQLIVLGAAPALPHRLRVVEAVDLVPST